jgi:hypothetical protein
MFCFREAIALGTAFLILSTTCGIDAREAVGPHAVGPLVQAESTHNFGESPGATIPITEPMSASSASPPLHHHAHPAAHRKVTSHHPSRFPKLQGDVANQLNQTELSRLQSGNFEPQAAPPPPGIFSPAPSGASPSVNFGESPGATTPYTVPMATGR